MRVLSIILLVYAVAFSQPCEDYNCDTTVIREILDTNGYTDATIEQGFLQHWLDSSNGRIDYFAISVDVIPDAIGRLIELKGLYINGSSELTELPRSIGNLTNIGSLIITNTSIESLPDTICNLTKLETAYLYNNALTSLPDSIGRLVNLQSLYIYDNQLTALPASIGNMTSLIIINVNNNYLSELPESIQQLRDNFEAIDISDNNFSFLPSPWDMPNTSISALSNSITSFPEGPFYSSSLNFIFNNITSFPDDMSDISCHSLKLGENGIEELPPQIAQIQNLKYLTLTYNELTTLPYELMANDSLVLWVDGNLLNDVPDTLANWLDEHSFQANWRELQRTTTGAISGIGKLKGDGFNVSIFNKQGSSVNIQYYLPEQSSVEFNIFDVSGRLIISSFKGNQSSGVNSFYINTSNLSAGAYYLRLTAGSSSIVKQFVIVR